MPTMLTYKRLVFCLLISLCTLPLLAQTRWSWGGSLQFGRSGEHIKTFESYSNSGFSSTNRKNTPFETSFALGLWTGYDLGPHWRLQLGLQYRQQLAKQKLSNSYYTGSVLTNVHKEENTIQQHSLEAPLLLRFYITNSQRKWRPFVGVQLAPAYLLAGEKVIITQNVNITRGESSTYITQTELDFSMGYTNAKPLQLTYGAEVGIQWNDFALSILHNRTFREGRAAQNPFTFIDCFLPCDNLYYWQARILRNTNLQLQYTF